MIFKDKSLGLSSRVKDVKDVKVTGHGSWVDLEWTVRGMGAPLKLVVPHQCSNSKEWVS